MLYIKIFKSKILLNNCIYLKIDYEKPHKTSNKLKAYYGNNISCFYFHLSLDKYKAEQIIKYSLYKYKYLSSKNLFIIDNNKLKKILLKEFKKYLFFKVSLKSTSYKSDDSESSDSDDSNSDDSENSNTDDNNSDDSDDDNNSDDSESSNSDDSDDDNADDNDSDNSESSDSN